MRTPSATAYPARIRKILRDHPDGLTVASLCKKLNVERNSKTVYDALHRMPDAYIDRWLNNWVRVWCVVKVPEHCPRPGK